MVRGVQITLRWTAWMLNCIGKKWRTSLRSRSQIQLARLGLAESFLPPHGFKIWLQECDGSTRKGPGNNSCNPLVYQASPAVAKSTGSLLPPGTAPAAGRTSDAVCHACCLPLADCSRAWCNASRPPPSWCLPASGVPSMPPRDRHLISLCSVHAVEPRWAGAIRKRTLPRLPAFHPSRSGNGFAIGAAIRNGPAWRSPPARTPHRQSVLTNRPRACRVPP